MSDALPLLVAVASTFLVAGVVKGVIGLGLPTVAIGLLGLYMPPAEAASLLVAPSLVTNLWQLAARPVAPLLGRLWSMMLGICLGTWAGSGLLATDESGRAATALGVVLALYAVAGLASVRPRVPPRAEPWLSPLVGAATGLVTAATGVFVVPAVPYLEALGLQKEDLVQALGLSFTVSTLALAVGLARDGVLDASLAGGSVLALAPALAGMSLGRQLRARANPRVFRLCFFLGLLVLGAHLALRRAV